MTVRNRALGQLGERLAEEHLSRLGAQLLARNYRIDYAEVDLLMEHEGDLVAVEVKTRAPQDLAQPEEEIRWGQLQRIVRGLTTYAVDNDLMEQPWRIDVIAIEINPDGSVLRLDHYRSVYPT